AAGVADPGPASARCASGRTPSRSPRRALPPRRGLLPPGDAPWGEARSGPRGRPGGPPGTGPAGPGHAARRAPLISHPGQVLAGPSVDLDAVTLLHEERHVDD